MLYISVFSYLLFINLNIIAVIKFIGKAKKMKLGLVSTNTSFLYLRWVVLLIVNFCIIVIQPLANDGFYNVVTNQILLDRLATIGFVLILSSTVGLYFYQYKYKKIIDISHSLAIVSIYVTEYVFITMMTIYFIFNWLFNQKTHTQRSAFLYAVFCSNV